MRHIIFLAAATAITITAAVNIGYVAHCVLASLGPLAHLFGG